MLARVAKKNCSIFSKEGLVPMVDVIKAYLKYAVDCDNSPSNTKYCVQNILRDQQESVLGRKFLSSQTLEQICDVWELSDYCRVKRKEYQEKGLLGRFEVVPMRRDAKSDSEHISNKRKISDEEDVILMHCAFFKNNYLSSKMPKSMLYEWMSRHKKRPPLYDTIKNEKLFRSIVTVDGRRFGSTFWEKNKKWAEQGAALVCLFSLGIIDEKAIAASGNVLS